MSDRRERSEAQREAARLERERRRRARSGTTGSFEIKPPAEPARPARTGSQPPAMPPAAFAAAPEAGTPEPVPPEIVAPATPGKSPRTESAPVPSPRPEPAPAAVTPVPRATSSPSSAPAADLAAGPPLQAAVPGPPPADEHANQAGEPDFETGEHDLAAGEYGFAAGEHDLATGEHEVEAPLGTRRVQSPALRERAQRQRPERPLRQRELRGGGDGEAAEPPRAKGRRAAGRAARAAAESRSTAAGRVASAGRSASAGRVASAGRGASGGSVASAGRGAGGGRAAPAGRGASTSRRSRGAGEGHRPHSRIARAVTLLALVVLGVFLWFVYALFQPFHDDGHGRVTVTIPPHSTAGQVASLLARDGVVSSSFFFGLRATVEGDRGSLLAGTYHLREDMSYGSVLTILTTPPPPVPTATLTITEGRTRAGVNRLLRAQGIKGNYLALTRHSPLLDPTAYGAPRSTPTLEGFLFPDTFQLRKPVNVGQLIRDQLLDFRQRIKTVNLSYARSKQLTPYDVLTVASLVSAESARTQDDPLVAAVIYNRLHDHMYLQFDSTTRYATGNYDHPLTESQLKSTSPWNTHTHPGLPPTPIDSPGLTDINAAAHPANVNYLYFVSKPCASGALAFATDYNTFLGEVAAYNAGLKHGFNKHC